jgi:hypothetical protein
VFPPGLEVESDGRVVGEGGQAAFGGIVNSFELFAYSAKLGGLIRGEAVKINNVQV